RPPGRRHAEEATPVRSVIGLEGRRDLAVGSLPMDDRAEVGKRVTKCPIEAADASLVRGCAGLRCMVDEIVREELFEENEIALALHVFGVAADHRLGGFAGCHVAHCLSPRSRAISRAPVHANSFAAVFATSSPW